MDELTLAAGGIAAVSHAALAAYLWRRQRIAGDRPPAYALLQAALLETVLWGLCSVAAAAHGSRLWLSLAALADVARYALWFAFLLMLIGHAGGRSRDGVTARLVLALSAALMTVLVVQGVRIADGGIVQAPSRWVILVLLTLPLGGALLIEQLFANLGEDSRWNAKPVCIGLACVFAFDLYGTSTALMMGGFDADVASVRAAVHSLAVPFLLVAARRRGDWIRHLQVSRAVIFRSATLLLVGTYLLVAAAAGYYVRFFGGHWGGALQIGLLFVAAAALVWLGVSGALRAKLRVLVGKHFFSYRFDYRAEWLRFTARLATPGMPAEVGTHLVRGLADMVECPAGALWMPQDGAFVQVVRWNAAAVTAAEPADSTMCRLMRDQGWVVSLDDPGDSAPMLPAWLRALPSAWLVVPLIDGSELIGFVVLDRPRTPIAIDWEVLDLLKTAARQAAGHLALLRATEALLEARKFEAFNRMSAFVVHDLKNIVTQLSLMLKNAERLHDNPEFRQDMLLTVQSSLERMRRLMLQLREGKAPSRGSSGVELGGIVANLQQLASAQGRVLEVTALEPLATRGDDDRLERVLGHLVQNAFDATPRSGRVWIGVERFSGQVMIEIGDTGIGMSEEFMQTRLFKPFNTTKHHGMGVGSYEAHQYVRELGGTIEVVSQPGRGTVMTLKLPLFDRIRSSDLMPLDTLR